MIAAGQLLFAAAVTGVTLKEHRQFTSYAPPERAGQRWQATGCATAASSGSIEWASGGAGGGRRCTTALFDVLVGADGTQSSVRAFAGVPMVQPTVCMQAGPCQLDLPDGSQTTADASCDAVFALTGGCRRPFSAAAIAPPQRRLHAWRPAAVSVALSLPAPCEAGFTLPSDRQRLAVLKATVATFAESPWDNHACRVTIGLLEAHGRHVVARAESSDWQAQRESLLHFAHHVLQLAGRATEGTYDFALFVNTMRQARRSHEVLTSHGETAVVLLLGEALAQAYYRDGSGLNIGLYGAAAVGRLFVRPLMTGMARPSELAELAGELCPLPPSRLHVLSLDVLSLAPRPSPPSHPPEWCL